MTLTPRTPITIEWPETGDSLTTTWGAFVSANDVDTVEDVQEQIESGLYAVTVGGGASPLTWIFA